MLESMTRARRAGGFTIVELLVVIVVVAIILALAVPSLRDFMARQRVAAINAELVTDLQFARSESVARNATVRVHFRDNPTMTCYTIYTIGNGLGRCDCRLALGSACPAGFPGLSEIKTTQVLRSTTVTIQPPAAPANFVNFAEPQGLSNRADFRIAVESAIAGKLRTATNILGRPQVCTPDGSIGSVSSCAD